MLYQNQSSVRIFRSVNEIKRHGNFVALSFNLIHFYIKVVPFKCSIIVFLFAKNRWGMKYILKGGSLLLCFRISLFLIMRCDLASCFEFISICIYIKWSAETMYSYHPNVKLRRKRFKIYLKTNKENINK